MGPPQLVLLLVAWALSTGDVVVADLRDAGPYVIDLESFSPCSGIGSIDIGFDVKLVLINDRAVYDGNLTFPYAEDDEDLLTSIRFEKWGSTGGWGYMGTIDEYDIMDYLMTNFPRVFKTFYGAMGVTGKPMPAGTYHLENFKPEGLKLEKLPQLLYGRFRLMALQSKNSTQLGCLQAEVIVKEVASRAAGIMKKGIRLFG